MACTLLMGRRSTEYMSTTILMIASETSHLGHADESFMRTKQLPMAATAGVIWSFSCARYWPYRGVGTSASVRKLVLFGLLSYIMKYKLEAKQGVDQKTKYKLTSSPDYNRICSLENTAIQYKHSSHVFISVFYLTMRLTLKTVRGFCQTQAKTNQKKAQENREFKLCFHCIVYFGHIRSSFVRNSPCSVPDLPHNWWTRGSSQLLAVASGSLGQWHCSRMWRFSDWFILGCDVRALFLLI